MKKLYKVSSYKQVSNGFHILLDGRAVKTKSGQELLVPSVDIAERIVLEWANQGDVIDPQTMPLTQIVNTKIDHVLKNRAKMTSVILKYIDTDLLCYLASEPRELVELQKEKWGKCRSWFEGKSNYTLETTTGLVALSQPKGIHSFVSDYVSDLSDDEFTVLQIIVPLSGSLILGLAMVAGKITPQEVIDACFVEEDFKDTLYDSEKCGTDPYIGSKKQAAITDLQACEIYLQACKTI